MSSKSLSKASNELPLPMDMLDYIFKSFIPLEEQQKSVRGVSKQFRNVLEDVSITDQQLAELATLFNETVSESLVFLFKNFWQNIYQNKNGKLELANFDTFKKTRLKILHKNNIIKILLTKEESGDESMYTIRDKSKLIERVGKILSEEIKSIDNDNNLYISAQYEPPSTIKNIGKLKLSMSRYLDPNVIEEMDFSADPSVKKQLESFLIKMQDKIFQKVNEFAIGKRLTKYEKLEYAKLLITKLGKMGLIDLIPRSLTL